MTLVSRPDVAVGELTTDRLTRESSAPTRWVIFLMTFALLSLAVPGLLIAQVPDQERSAAWQPTLLLTAWCGLRLAMLLAVGGARFFAFFIWLFTYIFMGIAPAVQMRSNQPSTTTVDVSPGLDLIGVVIVIVGVLCFEVGTLIAWATRRTARVPALAAVPGRSRRVYGVRPIITILLAALGLGLSLYYIDGVGIGPLFANREAATFARARAWPDPPTRAVVIATAVYPLLIAIGGIVQLRRSTAKPFARLVYAFMILGGSAVLLVAVNPISSARYTLGTVIFALLILFGAAKTRLRVRLTMAGLVFGLFFLFPLADAFRGGITDFSRAGFFGEYGGNPDYDSFWQVANSISYWRSGTVTPGFQALGLVTFFVPRTLWPGKPLDTGIVLANFNNYPFTNLSAPLWAEAMVNGGTLAVVGVFLVLGFVVRRVDDRVIGAIGISRAGVAPGVWLIVGAAFPAYLMILMRGSLLQATGVIVVVFVCLLLVREPRYNALTLLAIERREADDHRAPE